MKILSVFGVVFLIASVIIPLLIIWVVYKAFKRSEKRAQEKLEIEKQHTITLQKRVDELNERLIVIEKMLKEVE